MRLKWDLVKRGEERGKAGEEEEEEEEEEGTDPNDLGVLALHGEVQRGLLVDILDVQAGTSLRKGGEDTWGQSVWTWVTSR